MAEVSDTDRRFEEHVLGLLETATDVYNASRVKPRPLWIVCVNRFAAAFKAPSSRCSSFKPMFRDFLAKHSDVFRAPIFREDGDGALRVNDAHLKCCDLFPGPGVPVPGDSYHHDNASTTAVPSAGTVVTSDSATSGGWLPKERFCKGLVIYFDTAKVETKDVCVPIGEFYREAVNLSVKDSDDPNAPKTLYHLFGIFCEVAEDTGSAGELQDLVRNRDLLKETLDSMDPPTERLKPADPFSEISGMLSGFMKSMAPQPHPQPLAEGAVEGGEETPKPATPQLPEGLQSFFASMASPDSMKGIGTVVNKLMSAVTTGGNPTDIGEVVTKIGAALQDDELKGMVAASAKQATDMLATAAPAPADEDDGDAEDQS